MENYKKACYKNYSLKSYLAKAKTNCRQLEMDIIVDCVKKANNVSLKNRLYTKEELLLIGFTAFEIHRYFSPQSNLWKLKKLIILKDEVIDSISDLCKHLQIDEYRIAS